MRLVIIGAGFAGMYAALSAARLRDIKGTSPEKLEIALVAPQPTLVVRPRLYESKPETLTAPLLHARRGGCRVARYRGGCRDAVAPPQQARERRRSRRHHRGAQRCDCSRYG